jgi:hypothetical protein
MDTQKDALEKATEFVKTGRLTEAKDCLLQYLRTNPASEQAWLLMSYTVSDLAQQKDCLERVLRINPDNHVARSKLALLSKAPASPNPVPQPLQSLSVSTLRVTHEDENIASHPKKEFGSEKTFAEEKPADAVSPIGVGRLSRLRNRVEASAISTQVTRMELSNEGVPSEQSEKSEDNYQESFHMSSQENSGGIRWLPLAGIGATAIIIILIVVMIASGKFSIQLFSAEPTNTPTNTPIQVVSLPPEWTKTLTPTATITPTITTTPTATHTPTQTPVVTRIPTKSKQPQ